LDRAFTAGATSRVAACREAGSVVWLQPQIPMVNKPMERTRTAFIFVFLFKKS
jgi:hypothetical protein